MLLEPVLPVSEDEPVPDGEEPPIVPLEPVDPEPDEPELPEEPPIEPFGMISMFVTLEPEKLART